MKRHLTQKLTFAWSNLDIYFHKCNSFPLLQTFSIISTTVQSIFSLAEIYFHHTRIYFQHTRIYFHRLIPILTGQDLSH